MKKATHVKSDSIIKYLYGNYKKGSYLKYNYNYLIS
jgi:hypothetical protein